MKGERIDYTNYLRDKPRETDPAKIAAMEDQAANELAARGIYYWISFTCYADGNVLARVNGEYYGVFNSNTGKFFSGAPGDSREENEE